MSSGTDIVTRPPAPTTNVDVRPTRCDTAPPPPSPGVTAPSSVTIVAPVHVHGSTPDVPAADRSDLWLPLLRDLTEHVPEWVVLKNSRAALRGIGDVDTFAPRSVYPDIERRFRTWAAGQGLQVVVVCHHNWRGPNFVAIRPDDPYLISLDVKVGRLLRASWLVKVRDVQELTVMDELGYRRLREGAEGTLKLVFNGMTRGGRRNEAGFRDKGIVEALAADPEGALIATRFVGAAAPALRHAIRIVSEGGWSRRDMLAVEAWCYARALLRPWIPVRQVYWRRVTVPSCPVAQLPRRRLPDDREAWIDRVVATHPVSGFLDILAG